jgi:hypothetical protein
MTAPVHAPRCRRCQKGTRVAAVYELAGVRYDDGYCGYCGVNWPISRVAAPEVQAPVADDQP